MAMNFRIVQLRSKNSIHLNLNGDFDGTSAHELINALKSCSAMADKVFIHTNGLKLVHPFGRIVLQRNLSVLGMGARNLVFVGHHGHRLSNPWIH